MERRQTSGSANPTITRAEMSTAAEGARDPGVRAHILAILALALPPALLLQRQSWVVPHTGLGAGLGFVLAVLIVLAGLLLFATGTHPTVRGSGPVPLLLAVWALTVTASFLAWSTTGLVGDQTLATVGFVQFLAECLLVLALTGALSMYGRHRLFVRVLVACGGGFALFLLLGAALGNDVAPLLRLPGLVAGAGLSDVETARGGFIRPQGMAGHPLEAGAVSALLVPLAIGLARGAAARRSRVMWWVTVLLIALGSLSTLSRSAIICVVVGIGVMALRWPLRTILSMAGAAVAFVIMLAIAAPDRMRTYLDLFTLAPGTDSSLYSRQVARSQAAESISQHLLFGQGISSHSALGGRILDNQLLGFVLEQGIFVALAFAALLVVPGWYLLHIATNLGPEDREIATGLAGSLACILVMSSVLDIFGFPQIRLLVFVLLALVGPVTSRRWLRQLDPEPG